MSAADQNGMRVSSATSLLRRAISKRVLVVEDETLLALVLTDEVSDLGYRVVGPACTMAEARHLAKKHPSTARCSISTYMASCRTRLPTFFPDEKFPSRSSPATTNRQPAYMGIWTCCTNRMI